MLRIKTKMTEPCRHISEHNNTQGWDFIGTTIDFNEICLICSRSYVFSSPFTRTIGTAVTKNFLRSSLEFN